ncbi:uncharacterized protein LOC119229487 isoform X2 [Pungitius pungitius]
MKTMRLLWLSFTFVTAVVTWPAVAWPTTRQTTESPGLNLNGKMLTLSNYGGVSFSLPHYHPPIATSSRPYHTTSRPYHTSTGAWTTAPVTGGVSVCLRYLADSASLLFTLSPSRSPLTFFGSDSVYWMSFPRYSYNPLDLRPKIPFWANPAPDIWTRVCFTVDSGLQVAQVFSGSNFSIRKMLPAEVNYVWSGEPVIDFPGFDGQLTDVQVWDYPLSYKEVFNYMMGGIYLPYRGSALSWSYISYSPRGRTLLEDNYELQARRPISSLLRKHRPKGGRKAGRFSNGGEREREPL